MAGSRVALKDLVNTLAGYTVIWAGTLSDDSVSCTLSKLHEFVDDYVSSLSHHSNSGYTILSMHSETKTTPLGTLVGGACNGGPDKCFGVVSDFQNTKIECVTCNCGHLQQNMASVTLRFSKSWGDIRYIVLQKIFHNI